MLWGVLVLLSDLCLTFSSEEAVRLGLPRPPSCSCEDGAPAVPSHALAQGPVASGWSQEHSRTGPRYPISSATTRVLEEPDLFCCVHSPPLFLLTMNG